MAGKGIRKIKDASNDIKKEIHSSSQGVDSMTSEMRKDIQEIENLTQSVKRGVKKTLDT